MAESKSNRVDTKRHGKTGTKIHNIWMGMRQRCCNPNNPRWGDYGGRGIRVCKRWQSFENFYADMGDPPNGLTLDRYPDNDGDYEPGNCRWATRSEQLFNARSTTAISAFGKTMPLTKWSAETGIRTQVIWNRLSRGWTPEQAVTPKARPRKRGPTVTHCRAHGHEYTPDNTYVGKDGGRHCRACERLRTRKRVQ